MNTSPPRASPGVQGRVKVTIPFDDGSETVIDIFSTDDFLGESSLLGSLQDSERAVRSTMSP